MRDEPTELDREAAIFFKPARGMRVRTTEEPREWGIVLFYAADEDGLWPDAAAWTPGGANTRVHLFERIEALDTDDPATVGCMLAQVEEAAGALVVSLWGWWSVGCVEYVAEWQPDGTIHTHSGHTRAAALVAAMKAIKGAK